MRRPVVWAVLASCIMSAPAQALDLVKGWTDLPELVLGNEESNDFAASERDRDAVGEILPRCRRGRPQGSRAVIAA